MTHALKYNGVFESGGASEEVHDCTKPKADPVREPVDLDGGDEWQLCNSDSRPDVSLDQKEKDTLRDIREKNRQGGGHSVA